MITLLVAALASNVVSQPLVVADQVTVQRPLRVVAGVLRPTDGSANTNASFGVSYDFKKSTSKLPTITGAYLDYSWRDRLVSMALVVIPSAVLESVHKFAPMSAARCHPIASTTAEALVSTRCKAEEPAAVLVQSCWSAMSVMMAGDSNTMSHLSTKHKE